MLLYFVHIPKTAGSSLRQIFSQNFESTEQLELPGGNENKTILKENTRRISDKEIKLVSGHGYFGAISHITSNVMHFTFLRHPSDRFQSEINFLHRKKIGGEILNIINEYSCNPELIASKIEASHDSRLLYLDNISIRHICGDIPLNRHVNKADLESAKKRIINDFDSFYITEHFSHSVLLMAKRYAFFPPVFVQVNTSKMDNSYLSLDVESLDILKYDALLYEFCREKFINDLPSDSLFEEAVHELEQLSMRLGGLNSDWKYREYPVGAEPIIRPASYAEELRKALHFLSLT